MINMVSRNTSLGCWVRVRMVLGRNCILKGSLGVGRDQLLESGLTLCYTIVVASELVQDNGI